MIINGDNVDVTYPFKSKWSPTREAIKLFNGYTKYVSRGSQNDSQTAEVTIQGSESVIEDILARVGIDAAVGVQLETYEKVFGLGYTYPDPSTTIGTTVLQSGKSTQVGLHLWEVSLKLRTDNRLTVDTTVGATLPSVRMPLTSADRNIINMQTNEYVDGSVQVSSRGTVPTAKVKLTLYANEAEELARIIIYNKTAPLDFAPTWDQSNIWGDGVNRSAWVESMTQTRKGLKMVEVNLDLRAVV